MKEMLNHIPDVFFDWYARLLPGIFGVVIYLVLNNEKIELSGWMVFKYGLLAYMCGHLFQVPSSRIIRSIEKCCTSKESRKKYNYVKLKVEFSSVLKKISKAHAEAVGWFSTFLIIGASIFYSLVLNTNNSTKPEYFDLALTVLMVLSLLWALERCIAYKDKIENLPPAK